MEWGGLGANSEDRRLHHCCPPRPQYQLITSNTCVDWLCGYLHPYSNPLPLPPASMPHLAVVPHMVSCHGAQPAGPHPHSPRGPTSPRQRGVKETEHAAEINHAQLGRITVERQLLRAAAQQVLTGQRQAGQGVAVHHAAGAANDEGGGVGGDGGDGVAAAVGGLLEQVRRLGRVGGGLGGRAGEGVCRQRKQNSVTVV